MTGDLPRLAVFWDRWSHSPMDLAAAARDVCRLTWVYGWSDAPIELPERFFRRLGDVVDVAGADEYTIIELVRAAEPDGLIVFTEAAQVLAATIGEALGLGGNSPDVARNLSNKWLQRTALREAGIPCPRFAKVDPGDMRGAAAAAQTVGYPAVLKPCQGSASRDTFLIEDDAHLGGVLQECRNEAFVLEEYLADPAEPRSGIGANMVSVESLVREGNVQHLAVTGRFPLAPPFRETGSFMPSDLDDGDRGAVLDLAGAAAKALGVVRSVLHTEIKMTPDGPRIIEVNARVGGLISELMARLEGPALLTSAMQVALGTDVKIEPLVPERVAFVRWISAPVEATKLDGVEGIEEARALPGVEAVRVRKRPGDNLRYREGGVLGHVLALEGVVPDHQHLGRLIDQIDATLRLSYS